MRVGLFDRRLLVFRPLLCCTKRFGEQECQGCDEKVKKFTDPLVFACKDGFPMRASNNPVGGAAGQFHTTLWVVVPLQNPPGPQEGRVRESSLQALLRELAAFNTGRCVITTRTPIADIADHEGSSALRRDLGTPIQGCWCESTPSPRCRGR